MLAQDLAVFPWTLQAVANVSQVPAALQQALHAGVAATVPGCVHTDLMAAGLMADPYIGDGELHQFWIGRTDWRYFTKLTLDDAALAHEHIELVCDGLDTIATLELNGVALGSAANMHASYRFDLRQAARVGDNELSITFAAPMNYAEAQDAVYPGLPRQGGAQGKIHPHNLMRKMACNMGWDWGPDVATCGIWRPIRIAAWNTARIESVRPLIRAADERSAVVEVHVDRVGTVNAARLEVSLRSPSGDVVERLEGTTSPVTLGVADPQLWWPTGHGAQPLYTLSVRLLDADGKELDRWQRRIGLRTSELEIRKDAGPAGLPVPDAQGESMTLKINGRAVYCKGANWIPDDCFPHRITRERYRQRIEQARWANMNILRIWGGGIYEDEKFFELCDELGVMVWHDFLFACACYPEEQPYRSLVELEVRQNVSRLSCHPSLVIWNGCNENIWGSFDWGPKWREIREAGEKTWGLGYYLKILPMILKELDPSRPYWPASPYSGSMDRHPNLNEYGNVHIWDVWHGAGQYRNYLAYYPRMATEFGYHGPASYATIARSIPADQRTWNSPLMKLHNKNGRPGQEQTNVRMADDFVPPTDNYDDWHYLAQIMQARALSMGIEWFRALHPWNSGALYWQLNDCYPVSSWSAIDGDGRPKPLLYASRRFFAPRLCTIKPRRVTPGTQAIGDLSVYLHNDHSEIWKASCHLQQFTLDAKLLCETKQTLAIEPWTLKHFSVPAEMIDRPDTFLAATTDQGRAFWWFGPDKALNYVEPSFTAKLSGRAGAQQLTVQARTLIRDLCIFPDRLSAAATIDDNFVTLLPGDAKTFVIRGGEFTLEQLTQRPVLNTASYFGASAAFSPSPVVLDGRGQG